MGVGDKEVAWGGGKRTVEGEKKGGGEINQTCTLHYSFLLPSDRVWFREIMTIL